MAFSEYSKPPVTVVAERVEDEPRSVITPNGAVTAMPGDWEVRFPDGNVMKMTDDEFQGDYGEGGSEESGNKGDAPAVAVDEKDDNGVSSDKEPADDGPGNEEADDETRRPSPPPPVRRR